MAGYTHLYSVKDGDAETEFIVSSAGYTPPTGGSGKVDEGNYELIVKKCSYRKKKQGSQTAGANVVFEAEVSGPPGTWVGTPITVYQPQPQSQDVQGDLDYVKWQRTMVSMLSGLGKADAFIGNPGDVPIKPSTFVDKKLYARLVDGEGKYANRSQLHYWMRKEEYDAKPGPDLTVTSGLPHGTQQQTDQQRQTEVGTGQNGQGGDDQAQGGGGDVRSLLGL